MYIHKIRTFIFEEKNPKQFAILPIMKFSETENMDYNLINNNKPNTVKSSSFNKTVHQRMRFFNGGYEQGFLLPPFQWWKTSLATCILFNQKIQIHSKVRHGTNLKRNTIAISLYKSHNCLKLKINQLAQRKNTPKNPLKIHQDPFKFDSGCNIQVGRV